MSFKFVYILRSLVSDITGDLTYIVHKLMIFRMPNSISQEKGNCKSFVVNLILKSGYDYYQYEMLPF